MRSRALPPFRSSARLSSEQGQFIPLTSMVLFTGVLLMIAGFNIYQISKAKLQAQNLADATALAMASLEAKDINTVVDRNEWLNHMYSNNDPTNKERLPNISQANGSQLHNDTMANSYMNLVATINKAQRMFRSAYDRFLGVSANTASGGTGTAALADILSEIDGLRDPSILRVSVFNNRYGIPSSQNSPNANAQMTDLSSKLDTNGMNSLNFISENVTVKVGKKSTTLTALAQLPDDNDHRIGWMHPDWKNPQNTLDVQVTKSGGTESHWGAGATIAKRVPLFLFGASVVRATSLAYVVDGAGDAGGVNMAVGGNSTKPPAEFRPTFYARLAYHP